MRIKNLLSNFCLIIFMGLLMQESHSHEPWLMTASQLQLLKEKPSPELFTQVNITNATLIAITLLILLFIYILNYYTKPKMSVSSQKRNEIFVKFVPTILRILTAGTLIIAAYGLIPQVGHSQGTPTLLLPDIHISDTRNWLRWIEILIAAGLFFGVYIRLQGVLLILLTLIACYLYPKNMWLYAGYFIGIGIYLILNGAGKISLTGNEFSSSKKLYYSRLAIQIFTGTAFVLSGTYKLIYPNVDIYLLNTNHSFTFFIPYDVFTLLMALVEISAGILIITGPFLRIISLLLFPLFIYLSYILDENIFAHLFVYGILFSFIINGSYNQ